MTPPLIVLDTAGPLGALIRRLTKDGWAVRDGFALPDEPWDVTSLKTVRSGFVADAGTAAEAVLAAVRGAGVAAVADVTTALGRDFLADLERLGPVDRGAGNAPDDGLPLAPEQRALLDRLAAGESVAAAAEAEFLSLRTANRRLAQARDALGVRTTRQAVVEYLRRRP